jgi:hypothetical protein
MSENATAPTNGATVSTNGAAQLSDDEINALADAARDHLPGIRFVGRPLNFSWEGGNWFWKPDRDHEEKIGATEIFLVDLRSYSEIWKRRDPGTASGRCRETRPFLPGSSTPRSKSAIGCRIAASG